MGTAQRRPVPAPRGAPGPSVTSARGCCRGGDARWELRDHLPEGSCQDTRATPGQPGFWQRLEGVGVAQGTLDGSTAARQRMGTSQPRLHGAAALTGQPPACTRHRVFCSCADAGCTLASTITSTEL